MYSDSIGMIDASHCFVTNCVVFSLFIFIIPIPDRSARRRSEFAQSLNQLAGEGNSRARAAPVPGPATSRGERCAA
jgi:hypothetical protein